jgi:hypothetical protein
VNVVITRTMHGAGGDSDPNLPEHMSGLVGPMGLDKRLPAPKDEYGGYERLAFEAEA